MTQTITGHTGLCCLLGHPVSHSISPAMHNTAFQALGLDYAYLAFDVESDRIRDAVQAIRTMNIRGANLTMPLKNTVLPFLDELSEAAALSGSVNTIINDQGHLVGHTTDGVGFTESVRQAGVSVKDSVLTVLGAGGAAGSIIVQSALEGAKEIFVFKRKNRTFADTLRFCANIEERTGCPVTVLPMEDLSLLSDTLQKTDILCNATPVGMGEDKDTPVPPELLHHGLFVCDIIYHPEMTTLLKDAAAAGCRFINGKYMLLYQGAASFRLWTGQEMPMDPVRERCFS